MSLDGRRVWLATRGGDRATHYQHEFISNLQAAGVESVEVVGVEEVFRSAAVDLGSRASEWLESTAEKVMRGLRMDRILGRARLSGQAEASEDDEDSDADSIVPEVVVVDDPRLLQALRVSPELRRSEPMLVGLIDDFQVDTRWRGSQVDALVVPHTALSHVFSSTGIKTVVAGPPVDQALASDVDAAEARSRLGLDAERPVVVVATEHMDADTLDRVVFQLTLLDRAPTVAFHYGQSDERAQLLRGAATDYGLIAQIFGAVTDPSLYYSAATVVVAPADDAGVLEILTSERPVVLVGADRGNARAPFLADHGALLQVEEVVELGTHLETLLSGHPDTNSGRAFVDNAKVLVPREGTKRVVEALATLWAERPVVKAEQPPDEPAPDDSASVGGPLTRPAAPPPFEAIGIPREAAKQRPAELTPITKAEAKDQMAALIIREREAERALTEAVRNRDRWLDRLNMAKDYDDEQLTTVASERLRLASAQVARMNGQIETIRRSKQKLKARVDRSKGRSVPKERAPTYREQKEIGNSSQVEARFRSMEIERDLSRLRRKLDDDDVS